MPEDDLDDELLDDEQDVPDDIEVTHGRRLAQLILSGGNV